MRYKDWDIIIYPKGSDVPFREFKTTCYAINCGDKRFLGENGSSIDPWYLTDRTVELLTFPNRHQSDAACHLFRPGDSSRNAVHRLAALVGAAGSSWAADFVGCGVPGPEGVVAGQDYRRWLPCLVSLMTLTIYVGSGR